MAYEVNTEKWIKTTFADSQASSTSNKCLTYLEATSAAKCQNSSGVAVYYVLATSATGTAYTNNMIALKDDFKKKQYTLTYTSSYGSVPAAVTKDYGTAITLASAIANNTFNDSFTLTRNKGISDGVPTTGSNGTCKRTGTRTFSKWDVGNAEASYTIKNNVTTDAVWNAPTYAYATTLPTGTPTKAATESSKYTVTYAPNNGTFATGVSTTATSKKTTTYTYKGWVTSSDGTGTVITTSSQFNADTNVYPAFTPTTSAQSSVTLPSKTQCTRTGYTLSKWTNGSNEYNPGDSYTPSATVTLTAKWSINLYTLTYSTTEGTVPAANKQNYDTTISLATMANVATPTTYILTAKENGGVLGAGDNGKCVKTVTDTLSKWTINGTEYNPGDSYTIKSDQTATAKWASATAYATTLPTYKPTKTSTTKDARTVIFDVNGGTWASGKEATLKTQTSNIPVTYEFEAWYTAASGGTKITTTSLFNAASDIYAHYTATDGTRTTVTTPKATDVSRDGYKLTGWKYTDASGREITITPAQLPTFTPTSANMQLHAKWEADKTVVIHYIKDDEVEITSTKIIPGKNTITRADLNISDSITVNNIEYVWDTSNDDFANKIFTTARRDYDTEVLSTATDTLTLTKNTTDLYVTFIDDGFTVTFNFNGGTSGSSTSYSKRFTTETNISSLTNAAGSLTSAGFSRNGYKFTGWYKEKLCITKVTTVSTTTTVYAGWEADWNIDLSWTTLGSVVAFLPVVTVEGVAQSITLEWLKEWEIVGKNPTGNLIYKVYGDSGTVQLEDYGLEAPNAPQFSYNHFILDLAYGYNTLTPKTITAKVVIQDPNNSTRQKSFSVTFNGITNPTTNLLTVDTTKTNTVSDSAIAYLTFYNSSGVQIASRLLYIGGTIVLDKSDIWNSYHTRESTAAGFISVTELDLSVSKFKISVGNNSFFSFDTSSDSGVEYQVGKQLPITLNKPNDNNDTINIVLS